MFDILEDFGLAAVHLVGRYIAVAPKAAQSESQL
jgi:hypothetical protein